MNKAQRKVIAEILTKLEELRSSSTLLADTIQGIANEEQDKFDNLSEGLQATDRGQMMEQNANELEIIVAYMEDGDLTSAIDAFGDLGL